jgi:glycosyltransferase involved in cell wall biosynthesis
MARQRLRIAFLTYPFWPADFGGELLHATRRLAELAARGHDVTVLTGGQDGCPRAAVWQGVQILRGPLGGRHWALRRLAFLAFCARQLARGGYDVAHLGAVPGIGRHGHWLALWMLARLARARGARTVEVHSLADRDDDAFALRGVEGWLRQRYLESLDCIVSVGPALHQAVAAALPRKAVLIPYGIPDEVAAARSPERRHELRARARTGDDDVVFVFLGVVNRRKGADLLAEAFGALAPARPSWKLWLIGPLHRNGSDEPDPVEVPDIHGPLRANPQVRFLGRIDDRERLFETLAAADVFVFPTRREGLPISPMEAMALGLPVVLSRISGVTDVVSLEGETGLYVEPEDAEGLRKAMEVLGADPALRARMGAAAARRIHEAFGWKPHIDRWEALYAGEPALPRSERYSERYRSITRSSA